MAPPNFPVKYSDIHAQMHYEESCPTEFEIGSVKVIPIPLSHPNSGSGYKFTEDGHSFIFLTDLIRAMLLGKVGDGVFQTIVMSKFRTLGSWDLVFITIFMSNLLLLPAPIAGAGISQIILD